MRREGERKTCLRIKTCKWQGMPLHSVFSLASRIDGQDMAAEALRPRQTDGPDLVKDIIDFAVQVANEHLVPEGISPRLWERLTGPERFYLRMLDIETGGAKKLDNYQNFAKAFRYVDYAATIGVDEGKRRAVEDCARIQAL